jgi:hypothetical protein
MGEGIKGIYYFFEDRYYKVLDKINRVIPIYKIIDPIDKVFPSFVLFLIVVLLLIIFLILPFFGIDLIGALLGLFGVGKGKSYVAYVQVIDAKSRDPIVGAQYRIMVSDKQFSGKTDENGMFSVDIDEKVVENVRLVVEAPGYEKFDKLVTLEADKTLVVELEKGEVKVKENKLKLFLYDASNDAMITGVDVTLQFECRRPGILDLPDISTITKNNISSSDQPIVVNIPEICESVLVTANVQNYKPKTDIVQMNQPTVEHKMRLQPVAPTVNVGAIEVTVRYADGSPGEGLAVHLKRGTTLVKVKRTNDLGQVAFSELEPGVYSVSVSDPNYGSAYADNVVVEPNKTEHVSLELPLSPADKKLFVKVVDASNNNPIYGASVVIYKDDVLKQKMETDENGIIVLSLSQDEALATYKGFVSAAGYLSKVVTLIVVRVDEYTPQVVELEPVDEAQGNYGSALVYVQDEQGRAISEASVELYNDATGNIPWNPEPDQTFDTNADGYYLFTYLPPGTYWVRAYKDEKTGQSDKKRVSANRTTMFTVTLASGKGRVKVVVIDKDLQGRIPDANVTFLNATTLDPLSECVTDTRGECTSDEIDASLDVVVLVEKENYMPALAGKDGGSINVVPGTTVTVRVELEDIDELPSDVTIDTNFIEVCLDWDCRNKASRISSSRYEETIYYIKYRLYLFEASGSNVIQHIRVGPDAESTLPADGYRIKIVDARAAASPAISFSSCLDTDDPFTSRCGSNSGEPSKQVNFSWSHLPQASIDVVVKVAIEPGLPPGQELRTAYMAKAIVGNEEITTPLKEQIFKVGQMFCDSEELAWSFELERGDEIVPLTPGGDSSAALSLGATYKLHYTILNCSDRDLTGAVLQFWNKLGDDSPGALHFTEYGEGMGPFTISNSLPDFGPGQSVSIFSPLTFRAIQQADFTRVIFELKFDGEVVDQGRQVLKFSVGGERELIVEGLPSEFLEGEFVELSGKVKDYDTSEPIEGATVTIKRNNARLGSKTTQSDGTFSFTQHGGRALRTGDTVKVIVEAPGYITKTIEIPVRSLIPPDPMYDCVSIEPKTANLTKGQTMGFTVSTNGCPESVSIKMVSTTLDIESEDSFTLPTTGSKQVTIKAGHDAVLGINLLHVRARFESATEFKEADFARVIVSADPDGGDGVDPKASCFELTSYVFDLSVQEARGTLVNNCFFPNDDAREPVIAAPHDSSIEIKIVNPEIPDTLTFQWKIRATAKVGGSSVTYEGPEQSMTINPGRFTKGADSTEFVFKVGSYSLREVVAGLRANATGNIGEIVIEPVVLPPNDAYIQLWVQGKDVYGKFHYRPSEKTGTYEFVIRNISLQYSKIAQLYVEDFVREE